MWPKSQAGRDQIEDQCRHQADACPHRSAESDPCGWKADTVVLRVKDRPRMRGMEKVAPEAGAP